MLTLMTKESIINFKNTLYELSSIVKTGKKVPFMSNLVMVDAMAIDEAVNSLLLNCERTLEEATGIISEKDKIIIEEKTKAKQIAEQEIAEYKEKTYAELEKNYSDREKEIILNEESAAKKLNDAKIEAAKIIEDANIKFKQKLDEHELIKEAEKVCEKMRAEFDAKLNGEYELFNKQRQEAIAQAVNEANSIRESALQIKEQNYNNVINLTKNLESALSNYASQLRSIRNDLSNTIK